jgi:hypothetical protein
MVSTSRDKALFHSNGHVNDHTCQIWQQNSFVKFFSMCKSLDSEHAVWSSAQPNDIQGQDSTHSINVGFLQNAEWKKCIKNPPSTNSLYYSEFFHVGVKKNCCPRRKNLWLTKLIWDNLCGLVAIALGMWISGNCSGHASTNRGQK